jgi:rare lipoprotein A (peptidoglycan hydrolase)
MKKLLFVCLVMVMVLVLACYNDGRYWKAIVRKAKNTLAINRCSMDKFSFECEASWYSRRECCTARNPNALMANGEPLDDSAFTCASWDYDFGDRLKVTNKATGNSVTVEVCDRGPAKRLYQQGRIIDLSKAAFRAIADLDTGVIAVTVEEVN